MTLPIILDCDPGIDDAFSLAMALASDKLKILGVTTTYGNVGLDHTTNNALRILDWFGSDIPVFAGVDRPLLADMVDASAYHGETGLEAPELAQPTSEKQSLDAVSFLINTLRSSDQKITLVASGPLTNLAIVLRLAPDVIEKIQQIVFMGGSTDYGNDSPAAEFNMLCDPHAAQIVLSADIPKVMFGLNVTHQVIASPQRVQMLRDIGNDTGRVFADMSVFFEKVYREIYGFSGSALHDPCTIAWLLRPDLFETRKMRVDVDTNSGVSFGRTVHDIWNIGKKGCHTEVALKADADGFFLLLKDLLATLR